MNILVTCAAALAGLLFLADAQASGLDQLRSFLDGTRSARASFSQTVVGKSGRKPQHSAGSFAFQRPGKFRWVYEKPYAQLIVGDGEKLWSYDQDLNQVAVKRLGRALGSSPAALLAGEGGGELEKHFSLKDDGRTDGLEWVEAMPKAQDAGFESVRIGLDDNLPRAMEVRDTFGQTTTLRFTAIERNPQLPSSLFRFTPPKGADVVGE